MADLPKQTTYKNISKSIQPAVKSAYQLGRSLPKKKAVDTSQYKGLLQNVLSKSFQPLSVASRVSGAVSQRPVRREVPTSIRELGTVTVPYGGKTRYESFHPGVDVASKIGTKIPAFRGGTVTGLRTGQVKGGPDFGNFVIIKDQQGNSWRYSHLNESFLRMGQTVAPGSVIGTMGATGQTYSTSGGSGSHLDLRIKNAFGKYVAPRSLINS